MAWGVKGKSVDWNLIENPPKYPVALYYRANAYFDDLIANKEDIQNYLVDRRTNRVLGVVPLHHRTFHLPWDKPLKYSTFTAGGDYWKGENHAGVSTYWLRDESIAVVQHAGAWTYDAIYLAEKAGGKFRITEIGDVIESCFRRYLDRVQHRAYQSVRGADGMNVAIEAGKSHLTRNSLTMNVRAYVPKTWDDPKAFRYYGTMRLALTHSRNGLHAHVVSLKKRLRRPDED